MPKNKRNWSEKYEIVYKNFCKINYLKEKTPTIRGFCNFLGISLGKRQKWELGQWPSADDLHTLHEKMGFTYQWLITGEGEPFDTPAIQAALPAQQEIDVQTLLARLEAVEKKLEGVKTDEGESPLAGTRAGDVVRGVQQGGI